MRTDSQERDFVDSIRERNERDVRRILLENANNNDMLNLLLTKKYGQFKQTALHLAVKYGDEGIVKDLLDHRADVRATDLYKRTVLHTAADENKGINIMTLILRCEGVDVNAIDGYGNTPVKLAAEGGNSGAVRLLMENGADITIADKGENTALHVAVKHGHIDVLELLLEKLAHQGIIGKQNKDKNTPLHLAVESKSQECVALLLMSGATSTMAVKNQHDQTAAELAKEHGNKGIIELLDNPQKAREFMQKKVMPPRSASMPQLGRGFSVEADSPLRSQPRQLSLQGAQELQLPANALPVLVKANQVVIKNNFTTNVHNGKVAVGPFAQVVENPAPMRLPELPLASTGESHYDVQVNDGNVSVGDYSKVNVGTTSRTPSTAGSSDAPFSFPQPQENRDTSTELNTGVVPSGESSGAPSENPSSLEATMESLPLPVPEESPGDKSNPALTHPVQEENPKDKTNSSLTQPVQEENPTEKAHMALSHPILEESPTEKTNALLSSSVQEQSPPDKSNSALSGPIQEESPLGKESASLSRAVQEESPTEKARTPVQEESPTEKASTPVQEESPTEKASTPVQEESPTEEVSTPVQEESPTEKASTPAQEESPTEKAITLVQEESPAGKSNVPLSSPVQEESPKDKTNTSLPYSVPKEIPAGPVTSACTEELYPASAKTAGDSRTVTNSEFLEEKGAFTANSGGTLLKPDAALGQTWQGAIASGSGRKASPTRSVPKEVQDRLLKKVSNSPLSEMMVLGDLCAVPESQKRSREIELQSGNHQWADAVTKESVTGNSDGTVHRAPLAKDSGPAALVAFQASSNPDVEPNKCASVAHNTASCNAGACNNESSLDGAACGLNNSSPSARCSSSSKESPHRKERPCREVISDGTLPTGGVAAGSESVRTSRNDEDLRSGNHAQYEHSRNLRDNLRSEARPSTAGDPSVILLMPKDADHDPKAHQKCDGCCLM